VLFSVIQVRTKWGRHVPVKGSVCHSVRCPDATNTKETHPKTTDTTATTAAADTTGVLWQAFLLPRWKRRKLCALRWYHVQ
jgi:hypothetical protein